MKAFSASQLDKFGECQRRWYFIYREGTREPASDGATAGTKTHELLEQPEHDITARWKKYPIGALAAKLRAAKPEGEFRQEEEFNVELYGLPFTGRIDWLNDNIVGDWKTTSKPQYVKSIEELETNTQRLLYVEAMRPRETIWIYGVWSDLSVTERRIAATETDRDKFKLHVLSNAEKIAALPELIDPLSLPFNKKACGLYPPSGCPFKSKCVDIHVPKPPSEMGARMSKLLEKLNAAKTAVPAPEQAPVAPAAEEKVHTIATSAHLIDILFVDSIPLSPLDAPLAYATSLIAQAAAIIASDAQVPHHLLIDFGKGSHLLAAEVLVELEKNPVRYLYTETRSAEGKATLFALMSKARLVVRGMV